MTSFKFIIDDSFINQNFMDFIILNFNRWPINNVLKNKIVSDSIKKHISEYLYENGNLELKKYIENMYLEFKGYNGLEKIENLEYKLIYFAKNL